MKIDQKLLKEISDAILTTYYLFDKARQHYKKRRTYKQRVKKRLATLQAKKREMMKKMKREDLFLESKLEQIQEAGFESKPEGWTNKSIEKAGNTLAKNVGKESPKSEGFFEKCVAKMKGKVSNPEGYCAALKDEAHGSTYWRGKDKTPKEVKSDVRRHKNV